MQEEKKFISNNDNYGGDELIKRKKIRKEKKNLIFNLSDLIE